LYRLGRFCFSRRRLVALLWLAVLALFGTGAATLAGSPSDAFSVPGTEAQRAMDLIGERFPQAAAGGAEARVVFAAPDGRRLTEPASREAIAAVVTRLSDVPRVASVVDPFQGESVAPDDRIGFAQVVFDIQPLQVSQAERDALFAAGAPARQDGLTVEYGGTAVQAQSDPSGVEGIGLLVAAVVLLLTFGSLVAAGLPLVTAILGVALGLAGIATASGFVDLGASTPVLALMLGLAVAIDYALFIVFRYRHELADPDDHTGDHADDWWEAAQQAAGRAVGTAGSAVVFAGLTVIIALAGLSVVGVPALTQIGLAAAGTIVIAVVIAITLLPALLGFAGRRVLRRGRSRPAADRGRAVGLRWVRFVARRPVAVLLVGITGLAVFALPAFDLRLGLPDDSVAAPDSTQRKAYELLSDGFGPGFNGPLTVVVDTSASTERAGAVDRIAARLTQLNNVAAVAPPTFNDADDTALVTVVPNADPSSEATEQLVSDIRAEAPGLGADTGAVVRVTGQTAVHIDISGRISDALLPYLAVVVGFSFVLLVIVFRSVLVPLKAAAGFLLSVGAALGAVVAVFQWGWLATVFGVEQPGAIVSTMPIVLIGIAFGLAMDYQVFLVTRMREEYVRGTEARQSVITGFARGARVVTAAGIIMISVFLGFVMSDDALVRSVGFACAATVVLDAFVVRMTLVPALMTLLGRRAWWLPEWLNRILPNLDIEGQALRPGRPAHG
jgi:RND superfamily putative drug exporter